MKACAHIKDLKPDFMRSEWESSPQAFRRFVPQVRSVITKSCFTMFVVDWEP